MGILIDTNVVIDLERQSKGEPARILDGLDQLDGKLGFLAAITVSELLHGVHRAPSEQIRAQRESFIRACIQAIKILDFNTRTAEIHSRIWSDLQRSGQMIGSYDLLIAATALQHELPLLTGNVREFKRVPGLEILTWPPT